MANFDFVDVSSKGYDFVWRNRSYLLRVAVPVVFIKIACALSIVALGWEDLYMRQGLMLMPAFVLEALFVIGLIRYLTYNEPIFIWGKIITPPKLDAPPFSYLGNMSKNQAFQGGVAIYILLRVIEACISGWEREYSSSRLIETSSEAVATLPMDVAGAHMLSPLIAIFAIVLSIFIFTWTFRVFWLFVPIAMGFSMSEFMKKSSGFKTSLGMISAWLMCSLPLMVLYTMVSQLLVGGIAEQSAPYIILSTILQSVAEIIIVSVQVSAMTYGAVSLLSNKPSVK